MSTPPESSRAIPVARTARRVFGSFGTREIGAGAVALAILVLAGWWSVQRSDSQEEMAALRAQLAVATDKAEVYHYEIGRLLREQRDLQAEVDRAKSEPLRTWVRERARRWDAVVREVTQAREARTFEAAARAAGEALRRGDLAAARAHLEEAVPPTFPPPSEFDRLRSQLYEEPLAQFSRQSPELYRMFRQFEPEAAQRDEARLRRDIAAAELDTVTPQLMLELDLLAAVAAPDDPLVQQWSALASALDYFENPDRDTLARWQRAQARIKAEDWETAAAEMRGIVDHGARTRQPFRAAFGRALLQSRPDDPGAAYPLLAEAAGAGDRFARDWVAAEDLRNQRYAQAQRWLEPAVKEGDGTAVPLLLELYQKTGATTAADAERQKTMLEHIAAREAAPAEALLMLARLYERTDPTAAGATKAFSTYAQAAARGSAAGHAEVARCALRGVGAPANLDLARDAAARAFAGGEVERASALFQELLRRSPERTAGVLVRLLDPQTATPAGYFETRQHQGALVRELKADVARYLDSAGQYRQAARLYAGATDAAAQRRHAELTALRPCQTCNGGGRVPDSAACPTCGGKGHQRCGFCGGAGTIQAAGTPPCSTCGGAATLIQDRKVVTCSSCGGTGRGKGSVVKQDCPQCESGQLPCSECTQGRVRLTKECPDCAGKGKWALAGD